ncbi:PD-(D/E)XK nuclease family protein [Leeuwenhoekiella sp. LLG6367-2.1]|uniref:PD-(D/E)XK nuclease family protein n=1 Tax=Leeuwenhoekiella sp. LLG6367-2.1 TaxID=3160833 RepID=UPI00386A5CEC
MNLKALQDFLDTAEIPIIEPKPLTFLEIAKQPHYENVLSNIYAFFFDIEQEHGFGDLFINSLLQLIQESEIGKQKQALQSFNDFSIETEYSTKKGGRIDLLLHNEQQAIIIENKVYHFLNNDLDDYWESTQEKGRHETEIIGIILSLEPICRIKCRKPEIVLHFINITHQELIQRVLRNSGAYFLKASDKYAVYLKDFAQNIINMSTPDMKPEELQFYKENRDQLVQAKKFFERFEDYINKQIIRAFENLDPEQNYVNHSIRTNTNLLHVFSRRNPDLMFTIGHAGLWDNPSHSMNVIVELQRGALADRSIYKAIPFEEYEDGKIANNFYTENVKSWCHFAKENYTQEQIKLDKLSEFLRVKLEEDHLFSIFKKLDDFLTQYRSKS